jgi:hypothetical protein
MVSREQSEDEYRSIGLWTNTCGVDDEIERSFFNVAYAI